MFKKIKISLFFIAVAISANAQNTFPSAGAVGIGTTNPQAILDVNGGYVLFRGNGGYTPTGIRLVDDSYNTSGQIKEWAILKGNQWLKGLGFVRYDAVNPCNGGVCQMSLFLHDNGNIGIGTEIPDAKLAVNGLIHTKEVKVDLVGWPDYVFEKEYRLPTLEEVEKNIKEKGRLINVPSACEIENDGLLLGDISKKQQEKIEELTLYIIEQNKTSKQQAAQLQEQAKQIEELKTLVSKLIDKK